MESPWLCGEGCPGRCLGMTSKQPTRLVNRSRDLIWCQVYAFARASTARSEVGRVLPSNLARSEACQEPAQRGP